MAKKPEERFATAGEFLRAFKAVVSPSSSVVTEKSPVDPPKPSLPPPSTIPSVGPTIPTEVVSVPSHIDLVSRESGPRYHSHQQSVLETRQSTSLPWYKKQIIRNILAVLLIAVVFLIASLVFVNQLFAIPGDQALLVGRTFLTLIFWPLSGLFQLNNMPL